MRWRKWTVTIFLIVCMVGAMHAMNHREFHRLYLRFLNDVDTLVMSMADYVANAVFKLGMGRKNEVNKFVEVVDRYDLMMSNARPLLDLVKNDFRDLIIFFNNLESVHHVMKFLYAYFRQSAINIIDHLKRVYELS